jgi:hypothetical protein
VGKKFEHCDAIGGRGELRRVGSRDQAQPDEESNTAGHGGRKAAQNQPTQTRIGDLVELDWLASTCPAEHAVSGGAGGISPTRMPASVRGSDQGARSATRLTRRGVRCGPDALPLPGMTSSGVRLVCRREVDLARVASATCSRPAA